MAFQFELGPTEVHRFPPLSHKEAETRVADMSAQRVLDGNFFEDIGCAMGLLVSAVTVADSC